MRPYPDKGVNKYINININIYIYIYLIYTYIHIELTYTYINAYIKHPSETRSNQGSALYPTPRKLPLPGGFTCARPRWTLVPFACGFCVLCVFCVVCLGLTFRNLGLGAFGRVPETYTLNSIDPLKEPFWGTLKGTRTRSSEPETQKSRSGPSAQTLKYDYLDPQK